MDKGGSLFECRKAECSFASEKLAHVSERTTRGDPGGIEEDTRDERKSMPAEWIIDCNDWS